MAELGPRAVLRIFFRETDGENWRNSRNWMANAPLDELSGSLPRDLIGLPLWAFYWSITDLCAPTDSAFQEWLDSIKFHMPNGNCDSGIPAS